MNLLKTKQHPFFSDLYLFNFSEVVRKKLLKAFATVFFIFQFSHVHECRRDLFNWMHSTSLILYNVPCCFVLFSDFAISLSWIFFFCFFNYFYLEPRARSSGSRFRFHRSSPFSTSTYFSTPSQKSRKTRCHGVQRRAAIFVPNFVKSVCYFTFG